MNKNSQYRVRKHREVQKARIRDINYVKKIIAESNVIQNNVSNPEKDKNGKMD